LENLHVLPIDYLLAFPNHRLCALGAKRRDYFALVSHWLPSVFTDGTQGALGHRNAGILEKISSWTFHNSAISRRRRLMAVNEPAGDNAPKGAARKRSQLQGEIMGRPMWTKRDKSTGEFIDVKKSKKESSGVAFLAGRWQRGSAAALRRNARSRRTRQLDFRSERVVPVV
jgi:hypothetical protein